MRLVYTFPGPESASQRRDWNCRNQGHLWDNPPGPLTSLRLLLGGKQTCPGCGIIRRRGTVN